MRATGRCVMCYVLCVMVLFDKLAFFISGLNRLNPDYKKNSEATLLDNLFVYLCFFHAKVYIVSLFSYFTIYI